MLLLRPSHAAVVVLLTAGCNEVNISVPAFAEGFAQTPWEKVDVLLVVDNSCSMEPYQTKLAQDFGGFFEFFDQGAVDYQLAVTHTDGASRDFGRIRGPIVSSESLDPAGIFSEIVNVGTEGGGIEAGLAAAEGVISRKRDGFPRDDSSVSVIFVSDEQDSSPDAVSDYVNSYYDLRGHRDRGGFNASALTVTEIADCSPEQFLASAPGTRYVETAKLSGGIWANLCVDNFADIVVDLALTTSTMLDTFYLKDRPDLNSLNVVVGDEVVDCTEGVWSYQLVDREGVATPAIVFDVDHIPEPSTDVLVEYNRGTGLPEDFCPELNP